MENFKLPVSKIGCEDKIMQTRRQLDEVMDMMRSNIEKLSERSERLEDLACRAEVLDMASNEFQRCATEVRRKKMWKAYAAKAIVIGLACAAIISTFCAVQDAKLIIAVLHYLATRFQAISLCKSNSSDQEAFVDTD
ncbi:unnamed protein product [Haemonchus placei]|uniref:V-SNARE coiled-coil homology domain-containing protein n=1 Tax=Haemonchus placei TaxID=6290 RepID=A0A0N4WGU1_HAEPC|nr:unnamed protein product [Haemonchus placei]